MTYRSQPDGQQNSSKTALISLLTLQPIGGLAALSGVAGAGADRTALADGSSGAGHRADRLESGQPHPGDEHADQRTGHPSLSQSDRHCGDGSGLGTAPCLVLKCDPTADSDLVGLTIRPLRSPGPGIRELGPANARMLSCKGYLRACSYGNKESRGGSMPRDSLPDRHRVRRSALSRLFDHELAAAHVGTDREQRACAWTGARRDHDVPT